MKNSDFRAVALLYLNSTQSQLLFISGYFGYNPAQRGADLGDKAEQTGFFYAAARRHLL